MILFFILIDCIKEFYFNISLKLDKLKKLIYHAQAFYYFYTFLIVFGS